MYPSDDSNYYYHATIFDSPILITDPTELLRRGIVSVPLDDASAAAAAALVWKDHDRVAWARRNMMQTTPLLMFTADQSEPVYRNLMGDENGVPLQKIRESLDGVVEKQFGIAADELRLDDAFAIHYHADQERTSGAKHIDPSDITINFCLDAAADCEGSRVLFHGSMPLRSDTEKNSQQAREHETTSTFLVEQQPGVATLHWGAHPHETTSLERGYRTNIIMTLCLKDKSKSDVGSRSCYHV